MPRCALRRRALLRGLLLIPWGLAAAPRPAAAQNMDLSSLALHREAGELTLEFAVRLALTRAVDDALHRGVPLYFTAQATLYRRRWYWRDLRVARVRRNWRLAFQPLTATWRVSLGALTQTFATLPEALAALSSSGRWAIAELAELDPDSRHYVEFSYQLDLNRLPSPMRLGLGGESDWVMRVERELAVE